MLRRIAIVVGRAFDVASSRLTMITGLIAGFAILVMTCIMMMDVSLRYGLNMPTKWADEIAAYLMVTTVFLGLAYTLKEKAHICVVFAVEKLPRRAQDWLKVINSIAFLAFTVIIIKLSWEVFAASFTYKTTSNTIIDVIIWPVQLLIPLGCVIMSLVSIRDIYTETKVALKKRRD